MNNRRVRAACTLAALSTAGAAMAQVDGSGATVYGAANAMAGRLQHSLAANGDTPASVNPLLAIKQIAVPGSVTGLFAGGISTSYLGFRGGEELGGGRRAFFTLESGFNLPTGAISNGAASLAQNGGTATTSYSTTSLNGQAFNRVAFLGLNDAGWGSIQVGRNNALLFDLALAYDPLQGAGAFSPLGFLGSLGGGGVAEDLRVDNSVRYASEAGGLKWTGLYKLGGIAGQAAAGSAWALTAAWEHDAWGVQAGYERFRNAVRGLPGTLANTVKVGIFDTQAFMIGARYQAGAATFKAGYETFRLMAPQTPSSVTSYYGQSISNTTGGTQNFAGAPQPSQLWFGGGDYQINSRLKLLAGLYRQHQRASSNVGLTAGNLDGSVTSYSLLADYQLSSSTDVYAGVMSSRFKGAAYPANVYWSTNTLMGAGLRVRF
jgi:predicted porin